MAASKTGLREGSRVGSERPSGVRRSPRLVEVELRRDKLSRAIVVYQLQPMGRADPNNMVVNRRGIKKAWEVHLRGVVKHVYVERWVRDELRASVTMLARLPSEVRDRVERFGRYDASQDGESSSMNVS